MNWFDNLKTRNKLLLAQGLLGVIMVLALGNAYLSLKDVAASQQVLYHNHFRNAVELKDIRANQNANRANTLAMLETDDPAELHALQEDTARRTAQNDGYAAGLLQRNLDDPVMRHALEEFERVRRDQNLTRGKDIYALLQQGRKDEARALIAGIQAELNERLGQLANEMVERADAMAAQAVENAIREIEKDVQEFVLALVAVLFIGAASVVLLQRSIAAPLTRIAGIAERIAAGDLTALPEKSDRRDEVGMLA